jgi:hypothetical protein
LHKVRSTQASYARIGGARNKLEGTLIPATKNDGLSAQYPRLAVDGRNATLSEALRAPAIAVTAAEMLVWLVWLVLREIDVLPFTSVWVLVTDNVPVVDNQVTVTPEMGKPF